MGKEVVGEKAYLSLELLFHILELAYSFYTSFTDVVSMR